MRRAIFLVAIISIGFLSLAISATPDKLKSHVKVMNTLGNLPVYFIENQGQLDEWVAYYVKGSDKDIYFTADGVFTILKRSDGDEVKRWILSIEFTGAKSNVKPVGMDLQKAIFSYFKGKPENWHTNISTFSKIVYKELWPGIDLIYSGTFNSLKYSFVVKPGADPNQIRMGYRGAAEVKVNEQGELVVSTPCGEFKDAKPYAYQEFAGARFEVNMKYTIEKESTSDLNNIAFELGSYNPNQTLFLDPVVLLYCGYIGGSGVKGELLYDIAVDIHGNTYIVGDTYSDETVFPVKNGPYLTYSNKGDGFLAKVNAAGTHLEYCGYIGGKEFDSVYGVIVDSYGCAYITGYTKSNEYSFPVKIGPDLTYNDDNFIMLDGDAFVAKVNAQGTDLEYCGYIGGFELDEAHGIDIDKYGNAIIAGKTISRENSFPVKKGPDLTFNELLPYHGDAFVAKVSHDGASLIYCGYIGGESTDCAWSIEVSATGDVYIVGETDSDENSFPVLGGPDLTYNGGFCDSFIAKINNAKVELDFCGYIGGDEKDLAMDLALDPNSNVYVTGSTNSVESTFPVFVGPDLVYNGGDDVFIYKINSSGNFIYYCGYLGGYDSDKGMSIDVNSNGEAIVVGTTRSDTSSFPIKVGPGLVYMGMSEAFVACIDKSGKNITFCGYIAGNYSEFGNAVALDADENIIIGGETNSFDSSFQVQVGPDLSYNGNGDAFVCKILQKGMYADAYTISATNGGSINLFLESGVQNALRKYLILGSLNATTPGYELPGGYCYLPFNLDQFTLFILSQINTTTFAGFLGDLDARGKGSAQINAPPISQYFIDVVMYYSFVLNNPYNFVSNPVAIRIVK